MAKKLGKNEKTLLIVGGLAVGAYLLYKGMSGSSYGGGSYNGGTTYVPTNTPNSGGNSGGASVIDTVNTGLNIVKDGLNNIDWSGGSSIEDAYLKFLYEGYVVPYNHMVSNGVSTYTYPKTGNTVTFEDAKKGAELYQKYVNDPAGLTQYLKSLKKK